MCLWGPEVKVLCLPRSCATVFSETGLSAEPGAGMAGQQALGVPWSPPRPWDCGHAHYISSCLCVLRVEPRSSVLFKYLLTEPSQLLTISYSLRQGFYMWLNLTMYSRLASNPQSFGLSLPSAGINGVHHHSRPIC